MRVTDCPACYNLVQDRVNIFRKNLEELKLLIANIGDHPQAINDTDFVRRIREVNASVTDLLDDARRAGRHLVAKVTAVKLDIWSIVCKQVVIFMPANFQLQLILFLLK